MWGPCLPTGRHQTFKNNYILMKRKLISGILATFILQTLVLGQSETYSISIAPFSSNKYDEFSPVYYKNGIVFCTNRNRNLFLNYSTSENKGLLKINYIETTGQTNFRKTRLLSKSLRTNFNDGPASFSRGGDTIYYSRNLKVSGSLRENTNPRNKLGIFSAVLEDQKWTKIKDLRFNNEYYNITTPYISPDGKKLFFASDNPAGFGGSDLYYSQWKGDYWDDPVNLGPTINTSGNESYPFVNSAGGLFFSSDGLPGFGGKDIFFTKLVGTAWLTPVRLDAPINSQYDDFALITDSVMNEGFFSSKRGKTIDIYHYKTNIHQLFYCENQKTNQYCFKFTDEGKIPIDENYLQYVWNFGDGSKATGQNVEHCFPGPGKYNVKLDVVEKKSSRVFLSKLSYNLELKDIEQPVINSTASAFVGEQIKLDGLTSYFPGSKILTYTWYFGDGDRTAGENVSHSFKEKGDYEVKLGLIIRQDKTGIIYEACASKQIKVFNDKQEKTAFDTRVIKPAPRINIFNYDHAFVENLYSSEKEFNQDVVFHVEILTSKTRLGLDNTVFKNIPKKYTLKEVFLPGDKLYSYIIGEEMNLMDTYPSFNEISDLGFKNTRVRPYTLEDPAAKELHNLKRVFGVSADTFFRKNDFSLTPAGTQMLDLIIGFMSKYPGIKVEIATHTDNLGSTVSNQLLSQKRAEAMTNYLIVNGISSQRLVAKGFGGSRPIAPNLLEANRKLNRRVDFIIIKE